MNFSLPFDRARAEHLVASGLSELNVAVDGARQETYERYRVRAICSACSGTAGWSPRRGAVSAARTRVSTCGSSSSLTVSGTLEPDAEIFQEAPVVLRVREVITHRDPGLVADLTAAARHADRSLPDRPPQPA